MLAVNCEYGQDPSLLDNKLQGKKFGKSYIAFDFRRQLLVIKTRPKDVSPAGLPPALKPLDAELSFEDIASQGIKIDDQRARGEADMYDVVVPIHTRRPPKFYTEFEPLESGLTSRHRQNLVRRRSTAMDFVTAGAVSASCS
jgi:RNA-dependent RNA polymerase